MVVVEPGPNVLKRLTQEVTEGRDLDELGGGGEWRAR